MRYNLEKRSSLKFMQSEADKLIHFCNSRPSGNDPVGTVLCARWEEEFFQLLAVNFCAWAGGKVYRMSVPLKSFKSLPGV